MGSRPASRALASKRSPGIRPSSASMAARAEGHHQANHGIGASRPPAVGGEVQDGQGGPLPRRSRPAHGQRLVDARCTVGASMPRRQGWSIGQVAVEARRAGDGMAHDACRGRAAPSAPGRSVRRGRRRACPAPPPGGPRRCRRRRARPSPPAGRAAARGDRGRPGSARAPRGPPRRRRRGRRALRGGRPATSAGQEPAEVDHPLQGPQLGRAVRGAEMHADPLRAPAPPALAGVPEQRADLAALRPLGIGRGEARLALLGRGAQMLDQAGGTRRPDAAGVRARGAPR